MLSIQHLNHFHLLSRNISGFLLVAVMLAPILACIPKPLILPSPSHSPEKANDVRLLSKRSYGNVTIEFSKFPMDQSAWAHQILTDDIHFRVHAVYGISREEVLLCGGLAVGGYFRSILLRSGDGGRSWKEVATPIELGYASEIFFTNGGIGWALMKRSPEGIESVYIFRTLDYGKRWEYIGHAPNHGQGSYNTLGLRFVDANHGEVWAETARLVDNAHDIEEYCLCRTTDGGLTWRCTEMCCPRKKFDYSWISPDVSTAIDGTQWRYKRCPGDCNSQWLRIERRTAGHSKWETVATIPRKYKYDKGHLKEKK